MGFHFLFNAQSSFRNPGHSFVKTFVMTIGELDFTDTVHSGEDDARRGTQGMYAEGYILMVCFLVFMTISATNLLISKAISDIREVQEESEVLVFSHLVNFINECKAVLDFLSLCKSCRCFSSSSSRQGNVLAVDDGDLPLITITTKH